MIKPLSVTSEGGREVKVEALTAEEVMEKMQPNRESVWQPTEIYDTQLSNSVVHINVPAYSLMLNAERIIERRLLIWMIWSGLCILVFLLIH